MNNIERIYFYGNSQTIYHDLCKRIDEWAKIHVSNEWRRGRFSFSFIGFPYVDFFEEEDMVKFKLKFDEFIPDQIAQIRDIRITLNTLPISELKGLISKNTLPFPKHIHNMMVTYLGNDYSEKYGKIDINTPDF